MNNAVITPLIITAAWCSSHHTPLIALLARIVFVGRTITLWAPSVQDTIDFAAGSVCEPPRLMWMRHSRESTEIR